MGTVENTVFLSYRRSHVAWALAVFQHLNRHGYDVFFDFEGLASGNFEQVIVQNIRARAHFLVLLTPTALADCDAPGDWLRREVEEALRCRRNIVPLMLEGFSFEAQPVRERLQGELALLPRYNGLEVPAAYFEAAMARLREKFLAVALDAVLHPVSEATRGVSSRMQASARRARPVQPEQLSATAWFERGLQADTPEAKRRCYDQAIALDPSHAGALTNRALALVQLHQEREALQDAEAALRWQPDLAEARHCRGVIRAKLADFSGALADFSAVIEQAPTHGLASFNRGHLREWQGDLAGALADFAEATRRQPTHAQAWYRLSIRRRHLGDTAGALADLAEAIRLAPGDPQAYELRSELRAASGNTAGARRDRRKAEQLRQRAAPPKAAG